MTAQVIATATAESTISVLSLVAPVSGTVTVNQGDTVHVWVTSSSLLGIPSYLVQDIFGNTLTPVTDVLEDTVTNRTLVGYRDESVSSGERSWTLSLGLLRANVGLHVVVMRGMAANAMDNWSMNRNDSPATTLDGLAGTAEWNSFSGIELSIAYDTAAARTPGIGSGRYDLGSMWGFGGTNRARSQWRYVYDSAPQIPIFNCAVSERHLVGGALYKESQTVLVTARGSA